MNSQSILYSVPERLNKRDDAMQCRRLVRSQGATLCSAVLVCMFVIELVEARVAFASAQQMPAEAILQADPQPVWHRNFVANFNETTKIAFWSWHTNGKFVYAADQNAQRVDRENGRGDRYCMSIHPFTDTPCTHLVVGGQRYLIFPELKECCRCCGESGGCGVLRSDWLSAAEYQGQVVLQRELANQWTIRGLQPNNYYATADDQAVPLQLDQLPNDYMTFDKDTFKSGNVPPAFFDLPAYPCADRCPLTSVCSLLKLSEWWHSSYKGQKNGALPTPEGLASAII